MTWRRRVSDGAGTDVCNSLEHLQEPISCRPLSATYGQPRIAVFVVVYGLIATERIPRVASALGCAAVMVLIGASDAEAAFFSEHTGDDWNVVFLLLGMMIIVGVLRQTGVFEYLAIWSAKRAKARPFRMMVVLVLITALASALLDNVTTVLLVAPVTLLVCERLGVNPVPYLLAEAMSSNIGGTATLIGDPPNIIIASRSGLTFNDFVVNLAPIVVLLLVRTLVVLALSLAGFVLHSALHVEPAVVALLGAGLAVAISGLSSSKYLADVEWETLVFFAGLFIMVGALVEVGVISELGRVATEAFGDQYLGAAVGLVVGSAVASAIVDNIPFVTTMSPLSAGLIESSGNDPRATPLWWALALGADLGGDASAVGASANVVTGIAARNGHPISFWTFTRYGLVVTAVTAALTLPYVVLRYYT